MVQLEELYSVARLAASNEMLEEAYVYDTYGHLRAYDFPPTDVNRDGTVKMADLVAIRDVMNSRNPLYNVNYDGIVNLGDMVAIRDSQYQTTVEVSYYATAIANYGRGEARGQLLLPIQYLVLSRKYIVQLLRGCG